MNTTWKSELWRLIREKWDVGQEFTLSEVEAFESHFKNLYPDNTVIIASLRHWLQRLRDERLIEFVDDQGTYRRIV
jgi:hypothetical protein